jgi:hypothetical protein
MIETTATSSVTAPSMSSKGVLASSALAVPFLGFVSGLDGVAANISSTALVSASRGLQMSGGTQVLAAISALVAFLLLGKGRDAEPAATEVDASSSSSSSSSIATSSPAVS